MQQQKQCQKRMLHAVFDIAFFKILFREKLPQLTFLKQNADNAKTTDGYPAYIK